MEQISTELFRYEVPEGVSEYHAILRVTNPRLTYTEQVDYLLKAYDRLTIGQSTFLFIPFCGEQFEW